MSTEPGSPVYVTARADADQPFAVCLGDPDRMTPVSREQAWALWFSLQAVLLRTLPYPPTSPAADAQRSA